MVTSDNPTPSYEEKSICTQTKDCQLEQEQLSEYVEFALLVAQQ
jgi:hypothetical protein